MILCAMLIAVSATASAQMISVNELPVQAKEFVDTHFKSAKVVQVEKDAPLGLVREYTVILENGIKIEFNKKGDWKEVEAKKAKLPNSVTPEKIRKYVSAEFPQTEIRKIEKDSRGYEVSISNGLDLKFNLSADFIKID